MVVRELRARRIPAVVGESSGGAPLARVAVDAAGRLMVADADGRLAGTDPMPVLSALAATWGAELVLDGDTVFVGAGDVADLPDPPVDDGVRRVRVVGGMVPIDPARRAELAAQLETSVTVAAVGDMHVIVPHGRPQDYWPPAQRPVVSVDRDGDALTVEIYSRTALSRGGVKDRLAMRAIPDARLVWDAAWQPVMPDDHGETSAAQALLAHGRWSTATTADEPADPAERFAELGATVADVESLVTRANDEELIEAVVATFHLPAETAGLVRGTRSADGLPGAQHVERTGIGRMVWEQVMAPPSGTSLWARYRRSTFEHPRWAAALTACVGIAAAALVVVLLVAPPPAPWSAVLWVVTVLLVAEVVGDVVFLVCLRRRR